MLILSNIIGKLSLFFIRTVKKTSGSTWPGHLVLESNPNFIKNMLKKNPNLKVVLIAGTNGKTTTTKALHHILEYNNIAVIRNDSGANLLNGLASLLIKESNLNGKIDKDALLFEVDENSFPLVLKQVNPDVVILLNLFRDQLDRYGELNTTAEKWSKALEKTGKQTVIIANADDPQIVKIAKKPEGTKYFYSISNQLKNEKELSHAVDSTTCPNCRADLEYLKIAYSHVGNFKCSKCGFTNPKAEIIDIKTDLKGSFNIYNLTASVIAAKKVFGVKKENAISSLENFKPAFGRQEEINYKDKKIVMLLSKNPTGLNESLKIAMEKKYSNLLLFLNDRIPDGRDISWIWDVDFEMLNNRELNVTVSGDRTYDLANRLKYAGIKSNPLESLEKALSTAVDKTQKGETLVILPTYSAMLELRKILTGKSIL